MSKTSSPQILSPENYIRQRARNLPLHECLINKDWERNGLASITISRKHINGNITFCLYLVDLLCLGVKDTLYQFNAPESDYDSLIEKNSPLDLIKVDYNLVHNIIHAGWEYGEELGFNQHKDFLSTTQFMLEEDTDEIPLMEIKCGDEEGKPFYVQGEMENDSQAKIILNHLEKKVGKGNYNFLVPLHDEWDDEDDSENQDRALFSHLVEGYRKNTQAENIALFHEMHARFQDLGDPEPADSEIIILLNILTELILDNLLDFDKLDAWDHRLDEEKVNLRISDDVIDEHLLGLNSGQELTKEDRSHLNGEIDEEDFYEYVNNRWGKIPYVLYLDLAKMKPSSKEKGEELERCFAEYPDYALFKILKRMDAIDKGELDETIFDYRYFFQDRTEIFTEEFTLLLIVRMTYFHLTSDLEGITSLQNLLCDFEEANDCSFGNFDEVVQAFKIEVLKKHLDEQGDS